HARTRGGQCPPYMLEHPMDEELDGKPILQALEPPREEDLLFDVAAEPLIRVPVRGQHLSDMVGIATPGLVVGSAHPTCLNIEWRCPAYGFAGAVRAPRPGAGACWGPLPRKLAMMGATAGESSVSA